MRSTVTFLMTQCDASVEYHPTEVNQRAADIAAEVQQRIRDHYGDIGITVTFVVEAWPLSHADVCVRVEGVAVEGVDEWVFDPDAEPHLRYTQPRYQELRGIVGPMFSSY